MIRQWSKTLLPLAVFRTHKVWELIWTLQVRFFGFSDFRRHLIREIRYCKKETTLLIQENMYIFNKSVSLLSCSLDTSFEHVKGYWCSQLYSIKLSEVARKETLSADVNISCGVSGAIDVFKERLNWVFAVLDCTTRGVHPHTLNKSRLQCPGNLTSTCGSIAITRNA